MKLSFRNFHVFYFSIIYYIVLVFSVYSFKVEIGFYICLAKGKFSVNKTFLCLNLPKWIVFVNRFFNSYFPNYTYWDCILVLIYNSISIKIPITYSKSRRFISLNSINLRSIIFVKVIFHLMIFKCFSVESFFV